MDTDAPRPAADQGIALFDLDGTLLAWDCQLLFRDFVVRREPWRRVFLSVFLACAPLAPWLGDERMKRIFLAFLWKMPADRFAIHASEFADSVMPLVYPDVRGLLDRHRAAGDFTILASASPEGYVREIGKRLGFDLSLGTRVAHGLLLPPLRNHKGEAKVVRLRSLLGAEVWTDGRLRKSHGYTDSCADLPMLGICEAGTVVNPKADLEKIALARNWSILRPARPWQGSLDRAWRSICLLLGVGKDPAGRGIRG